MAGEKILRRPLGHSPFGGTTELQPHTTVRGTSLFNYPQDLVDAQTELDQIHNDLKGYFNEHPWPAGPEKTREPLESAGRPSPSRGSNSWTPGDAVRVARLRARGAELVGKIVAHRFWRELGPADVPAVWDALKDHR